MCFQKDATTRCEGTRLYDGQEDNYSMRAKKEESQAIVTFIGSIAHDNYNTCMWMTSFDMTRHIKNISSGVHVSDTNPKGQGGVDLPRRDYEAFILAPDTQPLAGKRGE